MKKIFLLLTLLLLATTLTQAKQDSIRLKECVLSYDDPTFQEWDGTKGIVERVTNNNTNFGLTEIPNYNYTFYQGTRPYFDESGTYSTTSQLPILNVKSTGDTFAYTKCTFEVGDRFIPYISFVIFPFSSRLTNDFNLTKGIVNDSTKRKKTWENSSFSYTIPALIIKTLFPTPALSTNTDNGVFPNTEFHKVYTHNLTHYPSSQVYMDPDFLGEGTSRPIVPQFNFNFYINNTNIPNSEIKKYLCPSMTDFTATNTNTGKTYPPQFLIFPGENIKRCVKLNNQFKINMTNIAFSNHMYSSAYGIGQIAYLGTNLSTFRSPMYSSILNITTGESKIICNNYTIEKTVNGKPVAIPKIGGSYFIKNEKGYRCNIGWSFYGSDNISYLAIKGMTTAIGYDITTKKPIFDIQMGLQVTYGYGVSDSTTIQIFPNDYSIITKIYEESVLPSNLALETETILDAAKFAKIGVTPPLKKGDYNIFNLQIPIEGALNKTNVTYVAKFFTKKLVPPFKDFIIAGISVTPYFKPGNMAYPHDDTLYFGSNSKIDNKKITLFNPSLHSTNVKINLTSWSDNNFALSWDGITFTKTSTITIPLYPLQSKDMTFWVNATYNPWVTSQKSETLMIEVTADLQTENGIEHKNQIMSFNLNVNNTPINWINLNQYDISPETIKINTINSTKLETIITRWSLDGSNSGITANLGKTYKVKVTLINDTPTKDILLTKTEDFVVTTSTINNINFNYDFANKKYELKVELDTENQIPELFSSGASAKSDNNKTYKLPVEATDCWLTDNYLYKMNFFGTAVLDYNGEDCSCPSWLTLVSGTGFCADPASQSCYNWNSHPNCNNISITNPSMCGWEATTTGTTTPGTCLDCTDITDTCSSYNNKETCNIDPCSKANYDCTNLACDKSKIYKCSWNATSKKCKFKSTINGNSCSFTGEIAQTCETGNELIINYISTDLSCTNQTKKSACLEQVTTLDFFSTASLIAAITLISLFYTLKNPKNPRKPRAKNKK